MVLANCRTSCSPTTARCLLPTRATARRRSSAVTRAARCRSRTGERVLAAQRSARGGDCYCLPPPFRARAGLKKCAASSFCILASPLLRRVAGAALPSARSASRRASRAAPRRAPLAPPRAAPGARRSREKALKSAGRSTLSSVSRPARAGRRGPRGDCSPAAARRARARRRRAHRPVPSPTSRRLRAGVLGLRPPPFEASELRSSRVAGSKKKGERGG
jgi:hypothetical protein